MLEELSRMTDKEFLERKPLRSEPFSEGDKPDGRPGDFGMAPDEKGEWVTWVEYAEALRRLGRACKSFAAMLQGYSTKETKMETEQIKEDAAEVKEEATRRIRRAVRVVWNAPGVEPGQNPLRYTDGALLKISDTQIILVQTHNPQTGDTWGPKNINRADVQEAHYMELGEELEL